MLDRDFQVDQVRIDRFAYRVHRRFKAAGVRAVTLDDIRQECVIAWCQARDNFDDRHGVPFEAYLHRGLHFHINRWAKHEVGQSHLAPYSLNASGSSDIEDGEFEEILEDVNAENPLDTITRADEYQQVMDSLSPRARLYVQILSDPPQELHNELRSIQTRCQHARDQGIATTAPRHLTSRVVLDLLGATTTERSKITGEVHKVLERLGRR